MYSIILVDDEAIIRTAMRIIIEKSDLPALNIREACDGLDALSLMEDSAPDIVITDIRMPRVDGMELCKKIRETGNTNTDVIIVSGYGDFKYAQSALRWGVKDYLLKPVKSENLLSTLKKIIESKESNSYVDTEQGVNDIELAKKYIEKNYMSDVALEDLAEKIGFNPCYFSHLFKSKTGYSFVNYKIKVRMERAREMLANSTKSISEVAYATGYNDVSYFTKTFKKYVGETPIEYKRSREKND